MQESQWFRYADVHGSGHCEIDAFTVLSDRVLLFEVKRTGNLYGKLQMEWLYAPILKEIYNRPVFCLLVCNHVTPETPRPLFDSPEDFVRSGEPFGTWHWLPN